MTTTHIPSFGECPAIPVEDLKPGMVTIWTGGWESKIAGVVPSKSGKTFQIQYENGKLDHRKMRKGRLIAIKA